MRSFQRQLGADAGTKDGRADRLGDVIDCAKVEANFLVFIGGHGGDENHRDVAGFGNLAQLLQRLVAVHAGHHDIEQDQVGAWRRGCHGQRPLARVGDTDVIVVLEQAANHGQIVAIVIDDQDGVLFVGHGVNVKS